MRSANKDISDKSSLIERLNSALKNDGDFPTSAKIVVDLRRLTADPSSNAQQITEVILRDPSLGARVLHIVNSSFYYRGSQISTISQAVVRLGMQPLAELCAGLVLLRKFSSIAGKGNLFGTALTQTILTSLLSSEFAKLSLSREFNDREESGYLSGSMAEICVLLLAFYFPSLYEKLFAFALSENVTLSNILHRKLGISQFQLSGEIVKTLNLPQIYSECLECCATLEISKEGEKIGEAVDEKLAHIVLASHLLSECIAQNREKEYLEEKIVIASKLLGIETNSLNSVLSNLPEIYLAHCFALEIKLPPLPEYLNHLTIASSKETKIVIADTSPEFSSFLDDIRSAVDNREPTSSILATALETISWGLKFDRALLLFATGGKRVLSGRMGLGALGEIDPKSITRRMDGPEDQSAEARSYFNSELVFNGDPIFSDGWPFVCLPVGFGNRTIGVIYADRFDKGTPELTDRERASLQMVAELLDRALTYSSST